MQSNEDVDRGVQLGRKIQKLINETMRADDEVTVTNVQRALSLCAAEGILAVQVDEMLYPEHVARPLKIFEFFVIESMRAAYPRRISPELNEHIAELQRRLAGAPSSN